MRARRRSGDGTAQAGSTGEAGTDDRAPTVLRRRGEPRRGREAGADGRGPEGGPAGQGAVAGADLVVEGLVKAYRTQPVLNGLSLSVTAGSLTAILGPSGSGKTTLLRVVAGFERADAGRVAIGGATVDDAGGAFVAPEHRRIGYVPQEGALFPHLTVERNVVFGMTRQWREAKAVTRLLAMVGMAGMGRRYPHQLSGGQQQRVALARAIAARPSLVLLDEPFSSLDASLRATMRGEVRQVFRRIGATALLVTHDQDEALSWADHVAVIDGGRIRQFDSPQSLYTRPADPSLARFVGDANLLPGTVAGGFVTTALGRLELAGDHPPEGASVVVLVRPEQLVLAPAHAGEVGAALVSRYEYFGHDAVVRLALAPVGATVHQAVELVARVVGSSPWTPGTPANVAVKGPVVAWGEDHPDVTTPV